MNLHHRTIREQNTLECEAKDKAFRNGVLTALALIVYGILVRFL